MSRGRMAASRRDVAGAAESTLHAPLQYTALGERLRGVAPPEWRDEIAAVMPPPVRPRNMTAPETCGNRRRLGSLSVESGREPA